MFILDRIEHVGSFYLTKYNDKNDINNYCAYHKIKKNSTNAWIINYFLHQIDH